MKNKSRVYRTVRFIVFTLLFCTVSAGAYAQQKTVNGKVIDADGQTLPGVTIVIDGTSEGTITDIDGNFTLSGVESSDALRVSFMGMVTQTISVGDKNTFNVTLESNAIGLNEMIVVGYGTQKQATLTGAVTQVKGEDLIKGKSTSSAALALQGEVPGLTITRTSSRPGNEGLELKIRGDISVNGSDPLILLDGLEIPNWQLSTINSNDIESMSVLKDGAAAIYGTKAAAGVILITTKKGKAGKMKVEYKGDFQMNYANDFPTSSITELAELWLLAGRNDMVDYLDNEGNSITAGFTGRFFTEDEWQSFADGTMPMSPDSYFWNNEEHRFSDEKQYDKIFGSTLSNRHTLSISGGNDKATYRTSLGYANDRSPMEFVYDGAKRYNFQTNVSYEINDVISTEFRVGYDNRLIDEPTQGVGESINNFEAFPSYNPEGNYYGLWDINVLAKLDEGGRTTTEQEAIRLGGTLKIDLDKYIKGLSFKYVGNITKRSSLKNARTTQYTLYDWDNNVKWEKPSQSSTQIDIDESRVFFQNHVVQANFERSIQKHNFGAMVGTVLEKTQTNKFGLLRKNMASPDLDDIDTGDKTTWENSGGSSAVGLVSYISRLTYDYNSIYILEALGRRDGSSRLHPDYRWKNFYSGMAAWRISEMNFLKGSEINNLKLRASYGETGSVTGINAYDYVSGISTGQTYFGTQAALYNTAYISSMTTTDRTWERVSNTNIGLDFGFINGRLNGSFEYFRKENKGMLIPITYPEVLGASAPKTNSGNFQTNGWELSINWNDKIDDFAYNIGVAMWDSKSEVTKMEGATNINRGLNNYIEDYPLQSLFVYETDGFFQNETEVLDYYNKYGFENAADQTTMKTGTNLPAYRSADRLIPGSVRRVDVAGPDGSAPDGIIDENDLVFYGDANPHYSFGINLGAQWKNFDFSAFFQGVAKQNILRTGTMAYPFRRWWNNQNNSFIGQTWTPENTDAELPIVCYNGPRKNWNYAHPNDVNVMNAAYLRAKTISLGYTIPSNITERINISKTRISISGNDLFVISNVIDGLDPEADSDISSGNIYPYNSSLMFSIEASF